MALVSPGVEVSVIDESFYTPAEPGTVPLIFIATQENKTNPAGTGIAPGTLAANAEKLYLISSQRELSETFGDPVFKTDENNNSIHGSEQNEYGLQTAYSFLGVSNRAYVIRANLNLSDLTASATAPNGDPSPGAYWFDTASSLYGIFEWNGESTTQAFTNKIPTVITDSTKVVDFAGADYTPRSDIGVIGEYALVAVTTTNRLWYKNYQSTWVAVGSSEWKDSSPIVTGTSTATTLTESNTIIFNGDISVAVPASPNNTFAGLSAAANAALSSVGIRTEIINSRFVIFNDGTDTETVAVTGTAGLLTLLGITAGTYYAPELSIDQHTRVPAFKNTITQPGRPTGSVWFKTTTPNLGANLEVKQYDATSSSWTAVTSPIYADNAAAIAALDSTGGGTNLQTGDLYIKTNVTENNTPLASFKIYRRNATGATSIRSAAITGITPSDYEFNIAETVAGNNNMGNLALVSISSGALNGTASDASVVVAAINAAGLTNVVAEVDSQNRIVVSHTKGGDIKFVDLSSFLPNIFSTATTTNYYAGEVSDEYVATLWKVLTYTASSNAPTSIPEDGAIWYNSVIDEVDIMIHNGSTWVGYQNFLDYENTDASGPIVSASEPTKQANGSDDLVEGDIWISTADIENFPTIYRRNAANNWVLVDKTDQTTENGILFDDARYNTSGVNSTDAGDIVDLLASNYIDPDAPDPALYPKGMLLWNLRRSGFNVKRFERSYIQLDATNLRFANESMSSYYPHRWVTESANNVDGSGSFGSAAQRKVVVQQLQAMVNSNQDIRDDESRLFNLMACPGYPELIGEMISLNYDRGLTAFIVGDSPMKLQPNTTSINNWANNINSAVEDNEQGLVSSDEYLGVYYPAGFTSDNLGNNIVVPPSYMALRTIALNDQVAYPWFAPAGTRRGGVTNATATGYINSEGEFVSTSLNEGQRDTLYQANVNPITFISGSGIVLFGQKTRARNTSALDRINVARLVIYLRRQLNLLSKPYLFEPNDKITRDEIKQQTESLLTELVGLRALYDFIVVCDESNNTPARIDRNELFLDIAIEPVKAVEFIYIPLRLKNTGEIAGL